MSDNQALILKFIMLAIVVCALYVKLPKKLKKVLIVCIVAYIVISPLVLYYLMANNPDMLETFAKWLKVGSPATR